VGEISDNELIGAGSARTGADSDAGRNYVAPTPAERAVGHHTGGPVKLRRLRIATAAGLLVGVLPVLAQTASAETWADRAAKYAPQLRFHPQEQWWPVKAAWFVDHSRLRFSEAGWPDHQLADTGSVSEQRLGGNTGATPYSFGYNGHTYQSSDCTRPYTSTSTPNCAGADDRAYLADQEGYFLDLDDNYEHGERSTSTDPGVYTADVHTYFQHGALDTGGYYMTYWFMYAYDKFTWSGPDQYHEGDWERISIRFDDNFVPQTVAWFYHGCGAIKLSWANVPRVQTTHPVSYVGEGSHANYPDTSPPDICGFPGDYVYDNVSNAGKRFNTWADLVDTSDAGWFGYGGAWGSVANPDQPYRSDFTGPLGPSRYKDPSPWDEVGYPA